MIKLIRNILIIVAIMLCTAVCVAADSEFCVSGAMITQYNGNADVVIVPAIIDGVEIAGIDTNAFQNKDMHTVIIEDGIEVIQPKAFIGCENLQCVKSPDSMLLINEDAFFECSPRLQLDVSDETYVMNDARILLFSDTESENYNGFLYSENTITGYIGEETEIVIPDVINEVTITTIAPSAFEGNTAIASVTIPDTVTTIGSNAFKGCTALIEVSLSKNLSSAGEGAFSGCSSLKSVTIPGSLKRISKNMFYGCSSLTDVVLESGVQNTGAYAFYNCTVLKNISVPSTLKSIDVWSFGYCYALEEFSIPEGVTIIDSAAFYLCNKLNNVMMPDTVTSIGSHAFRACSSLVNLKVSKNIERIPYRSFNGCMFSKFTVPQKTTHIDSESFYQCQQLVSIEIPDNVVSIGTQAFYGCFRMKECIIYGEEVAFGTNPFLYVAGDCKIWVPGNSNTSKSAEEKEISVSYIQDCASVTEQQLYINDSIISSETSVTIKKGDKISVKYRTITANDTDNDVFLAFLLYDSEGAFLGMKRPDADVTILANSVNHIEYGIEVEDEAHIKVVLWKSIAEMKPLCQAIGV